MNELVLVTGVAGFIGSNLAKRLLAEGYRVRGIDNLAYGLRENIPAGVDFIQADIRDRDIESAFRGAEFVFHLAAKNCISDCQQDPVETSEINVFGTVNVFEAARRAGVKKLIYAESSALYEGSKLLPTPETEVKPESFYSISKAAGMHFADGYRRFSSLNIVALRYFCVYGPAQDYRRTIPPVMSAFIIKLLKGEQPIIYGSGQKRRDFVYVDDVNDFHLLCLKDNRVDHGVFNIGGGENYSVLEIYDVVESVLQTGIKPIFRPDMPGEASVTLADIAAAERVGWKPRTSLKTGIERAIDYIRSEISSGRV